MRKLALVVMVAGCTEAASPEPDLPVVIVHVGNSTATISFSDLLRPAVLADGVYTAAVVPGSSVSSSYTSSSSPSSSWTTTRTMHGIVPGDELWFTGVAPSEPRPQECQCETPRLVPTDSGSTWEDSDPAAIDARLIRTTTTITMPYSTNSDYLIIDGIADNHIGSRSTPMTPDPPQHPPELVTVQTLKCDGLTYDDLRNRLHNPWFDCTQ